MSPLGMRIGIAAMMTAIAASGPAVAALGRPAVVVGGIVLIGAGVWWVANEVASDTPPSDIGPAPWTTPANPDPFEPCQRANTWTDAPDDRTPEEGGTLSVEKLRAISQQNLDRTGCVRPRFAHNHHGIPLREKAGGVGTRLRAWARDNNINLTDEANQIYLPKQPNAGTRAIPHNHSLHTKAALEELERRLIARTAQGMAPRNALKATLEEMARGTFTW